MNGQAKIGFTAYWQSKGGGGKLDEQSAKARGNYICSARWNLRQSELPLVLKRLTSLSLLSLLFFEKRGGKCEIS